MTTKIMPLSSYNIKTLVKLWNEAFADYMIPVNVDAESLNDRIETNHISRDDSLVIEVDGTPAGMLLSADSEVSYIGEPKHVSWVGGLAIHPDFRQHGLASILMEKNEADMRKKGVTLMCFEVIKENDRAVKLYDKLGFSQDKEVKHVTFNVKKFPSFPEVTIKHVELDDPNIQAENIPWQNRPHTGGENVSFSIAGNTFGHAFVQKNETAVIIKQIILGAFTPDLFLSSYKNLAKHYGVENLTFSNIDDDNPAFMAIEKKLNKNYITQIMMTKKL